MRSKVNNNNHTKQDDYIERFMVNLEVDNKTKGILNKTKIENQNMQQSTRARGNKTKNSDPKKRNKRLPTANCDLKEQKNLLLLNYTVECSPMTKKNQEKTNKEIRKSCNKEVQVKINKDKTKENEQTMKQAILEYEKKIEEAKNKVKAITLENEILKNKAEDYKKVIDTIGEKYKEIRNKLEIYKEDEENSQKDIAKIFKIKKENNEIREENEKLCKLIDKIHGYGMQITQQDTIVKHFFIKQINRKII